MFLKQPAVFCPPRLLSHACGGVKELAAGDNAGNGWRVAGVKRQNFLLLHSLIKQSTPQQTRLLVRAEIAAFILIKPLFWKTPRWRSKRHFIRRMVSTDLEGGMMRCASCGIAENDETKLKICAACQSARYCSISCQKDHRSNHKNCVRSGWVKYVRRFCSSNPKTRIRGTARSAYCLYRLITMTLQ